MRRPGIFLALAGLGLLAGCAVWQADRTGYFVTWNELPAPPDQALELVISREFDLYVTTQDGRTLRWNNRSWEVSGVPEDLDDGWSIIRPCVFAWPQFSPLSNAPAAIKECIQDEGVYAEFHNKHVYVLDEDGGIWQWELIRHGFDDLIRMGSYPCAGAILGLVVASAILLIFRSSRSGASVESEVSPENSAG